MTVAPEVLFVTNQPRLFRYFVRAVGHIDTARDLTQDVFLRITRAAIPEGEIRAWMLRIARNLALDHHRNEAFDSDELAHALSDPDGRALLIDLLALRHVMQPAKGALVIAGQRKPSRVRGWLAVAAVLIAMIGGYLLGQRRVELTDDAPSATRVIAPRAGWQPLPSGE